MISAKEAKALSTPYSEEKIVIAKIERKINEAALLGKTSIQTDKFGEFVRGYLVNYGYQITANERPGPGKAYTISWDNEL